MVDVGEIESGEVDNKANAARLKHNAKRLRRFDEALAESKEG